MVTVVVPLIAAFTAAPPLRAQSGAERGEQASFTIGTSLGDGKSALALSLGLGARVSSRVGVEVEVAHARKLDFTLDLCPAPLLCVVGGRIPVTGRTVSLVPQVAIHLRPTSARSDVYLQGGIGAGHVRQRYFVGPPLGPNDAERTRSNFTLAFAFGGGVAMKISQRVALGVDVRSLHLRDDPPALDRFIVPADMLSTLRIGSRVSWQF